jgi:hypothetical protein
MEDDENGNFKKNEVITEIKLEVLKKLSGNKLNLDSTNFDLSSNLFFIKNLDFMKDS